MHACVCVCMHACIRDLTILNEITDVHCSEIRGRCVCVCVCVCVYVSLPLSGPSISSLTIMYLDCSVLYSNCKTMTLSEEVARQHYSVTCFVFVCLFVVVFS